MNQSADRPVAQDTHRLREPGAPTLPWLALTLMCMTLSCATAPTETETGALPAALDDSVWEVIAWHQVDDLPREIARLQTVFWDPRDTVSLRKLIRETPLVKDKTVLEIGTGTGLLSLYALQFGAAKVVATDVNPAAVANAIHNARLLDFEERFEARLVSLKTPAAFSVIADEETFDVILSNPPWVNRRPLRIEEFALYDENFHLMRTLLEGLGKHLNPGGRVLLAYGSVDGIRTLTRMAGEMNMTTKVIGDDRNLDELEEEFLPGMLIEVKVSPSKR